MCAEKREEEEERHYCNKIDRRDLQFEGSLIKIIDNNLPQAMSSPPVHPSAQQRRESFARRAESLIERVRSFNTIIYEVSLKNS